jgi:hypothetical protein
LVVFGLTVAAALPLSAQAEPRGVVELFTSQGCSSCPPADKLMGELSTDPSLVTISLPIDYWDYLGWRDTLASPANSALQRGYARARGDRQVYTPQVVVNGTMHALGSDRSAIEKALTLTRREGAVLSLPVTMAVADGKLNVAVARGNGDADPKAAEVWLCALSREVPVLIERGENRGRTITYHNVARRWLKLGDWNGKASTYAVPVAELESDGADAVAVLVQAGTAEKPGPVLGAAEAPLE